jgi:hypothetical protein
MLFLGLSASEFTLNVTFAVISETLEQQGHVHDAAALTAATAA